jgi:cobalt-precorrin-5B (C1)-methyltransferase
MEEYVVKDGKKLRMGYTTGSCAAAAAKAAAWMLLTGKRLEKIRLLTPKGIPLELEVLEAEISPEMARCAIRKDSGDDPDVTHGTLVFAEVRPIPEPGVEIDGGFGVGRVTKRGLDQPVGNAAINSVPRQMIRENLEEVMRLTDHRGGLRVIVSVPEGERLAKKTFNPRLGIVGGISILGTTGIVEPMSESALVETIRVELRQKRAGGADYVLLTPGNYGSDFLKGSLDAAPGREVQVSNFIGDGIDLCRDLGFRGFVLVGHIGKLVKLAGNMMNTHSKYGDCRMDILAACAGACGLGRERIREMLDCAACDDALRILKEEGVFEETLALLLARMEGNLRHRAGEELEAGVLTFSNVYGVLGESANARELLKKAMEG